MQNLGEKCGVFGIYGKDLDVCRLTFYGLFALQHRGQESSAALPQPTEITSTATKIWAWLRRSITKKPSKI